MTENLDTGDDADSGVLPADDNTELARVLDPKSFQAEEGPKKIHGSDRHGLLGAVDEQNKKRGAEAKRIRIRSVDRDDRPIKDARDAAERIAFSRRYDRGIGLVEATGARSGDAMSYVGASVKEMAEREHEPIPREYVDKDARPNARKAAADLVEARNVTDPAEAQERDQKFKTIVDLLNGDEELARQALGEQVEQSQPDVQQPSPVEPAQTEQQHEVDPVAQARQQAAAWVQATAQLHNMTQAEVLADAQIRTALQQHIAEFGNDVKSYADAARLSPDRQQRFWGQQQVLKAAYEQYQNLSAQRQLTQQQIAAAQQAEQDQAFQRYRAEQNAAVEKAIPELSPSADPAEAYAFKKAATDLIKTHLGIDQQTARSLSPELQRALHHAGFAEIIAKAVRFDQGQERVRQARPVQPHPVQRPGVRQDRSDRAQADLSHLDQRIDRLRPGSDRQLRAAANLIAQRRANRSR